MPRLARMAAGLGTASFHLASGAIESGILDLGATPTTAPSYTLNATMPSGTSVSVVASRSSPDGVAWSSWSAPQGGALTSPLARYWQLELSLQTTAPQSTPTLVAVTITVTDEMQAGWTWNYGGRWA